MRQGKELKSKGQIRNIIQCETKRSSYKQLRTTKEVILVLLASWLLLLFLCRNKEKRQKSKSRGKEIS